MPAGTIALTNNSAAVTGTGTSFTSELKANDFVVVVVGGVTYTLGIKSVDSATALTLVSAYGGATISGLSWTPVPNATLVGITAQVAADVAKAIRGINLDKANWQQVYSASGNITVTLPDGSQYSGPSWNAVAGSVTGKMDKSQNLNDLSDKPTARNNLGLGDSATRNVGTGANNVAAGNDSRLSTVNQKTGGTLTTALLSPGVASNAPMAASSQGTYLGWNEYNDGGATLQCNRGGGNGGFKFRVVNNTNTSEITLFNLAYTGVGYAPGGWITGSDERIKEDIKEIDPEFALDAVLNLRHVTFKMRDRPDGEGGWVESGRSVGYLAADLEKYLPDAVTTQRQPDEFAYRCRGDNDEIVIVNNLKSIDPGKAAAALNGSAIKALHSRIEKQDAIIAELQSRMKAIDGLDA